MFAVSVISDITMIFFHRVLFRSSQPHSVSISIFLIFRSWLLRPISAHLIYREAHNLRYPERVFLDTTCFLAATLTGSMAFGIGSTDARRNYIVANHGTTYNTAYDAQVCSVYNWRSGSFPISVIASAARAMSPRTLQYSMCVISPHIM